MSIGSTWRTAPSDSIRRKVCADLRLRRQAHRNGKRRTYSVPSYVSGDSLIDRVQASIAGDMLADIHALGILA